MNSKIPVSKINKYYRDESIGNAETLLLNDFSLNKLKVRKCKSLDTILESPEIKLKIPGLKTDEQFEECLRPIKMVELKKKIQKKKLEDLYKKEMQVKKFDEVCLVLEESGKFSESKGVDDYKIITQKEEIMKTRLSDESKEWLMELKYFEPKSRPTRIPVPVMSPSPRSSSRFRICTELKEITNKNDFPHSAIFYSPDEKSDSQDLKSDSTSSLGIAELECLVMTPETPETISTFKSRVLCPEPTTPSSVQSSRSMSPSAGAHEMDSDFGSMDTDTVDSDTSECGSGFITPTDSEKDPTNNISKTNLNMDDSEWIGIEKEINKVTGNGYSVKKMQNICKFIHEDNEDIAASTPEIEFCTQNENFIQSQENLQHLADSAYAIFINQTFAECDQNETIFGKQIEHDPPDTTFVVEKSDKFSANMPEFVPVVVESDTIDFSEGYSSTSCVSEEKHHIVNKTDHQKLALVQDEKIDEEANSSDVVTSAKYNQTENIKQNHLSTTSDYAHRMPVIKRIEVLKKFTSKLKSKFLKVGTPKCPSLQRNTIDCSAYSSSTSVVNEKDSTFIKTDQQKPDVDEGNIDQASNLYILKSRYDHNDTISGKSIEYNQLSTSFDFKKQDETCTNIINKLTELFLRPDAPVFLPVKPNTIDSFAEKDFNFIEIDQQEPNIFEDKKDQALNFSFVIDDYDQPSTSTAENDTSSTTSLNPDAPGFVPYSSEQNEWFPGAFNTNDIINQRSYYFINSNQQSPMDKLVMPEETDENSNTEFDFDSLESPTSDDEFKFQYVRGNIYGEDPMTNFSEFGVDPKSNFMTQSMNKMFNMKRSKIISPLDRGRINPLGFIELPFQNDLLVALTLDLGILLLNRVDKVFLALSSDEEHAGVHFRYGEVYQNGNITEFNCIDDFNEISKCARIIENGIIFQDELSPTTYFLSVAGIATCPRMSNSIAPDFLSQIFYSGSRCGNEYVEDCIELLAQSRFVIQRDGSMVWFIQNIKIKQSTDGQLVVHKCNAAYTLIITPRALTGENQYTVASRLTTPRIHVTCSSTNQDQNNTFHMYAKHAGKKLYYSEEKFVTRYNTQSAGVDDSHQIYLDAK